MADFLVDPKLKLRRNPKTMTRFNLDGSVYVFHPEKQKPSQLSGALAQLWTKLDFPMELSKILRNFSEADFNLEKEILQLFQLDLLVKEK